MKLKTTTETKYISFDGKLQVLSQKGYDVKVKLLLLNNKKNRNNWIYENIEEHLNEFKWKPILISYKNGQLGAGHEMDKTQKPDGSISLSFMSETAERIVGVISENAVMRIENIDGVDWVVTDDAIIFGWYAPELAKRLNETGTLSDSEKTERSMRVSIETLIDEGRIEKDGTEIYTKWRVLGTTILNDNVSEAVKGANIRALAEIGTDKIQEITKLRVASAFSQNNNPQKNNKKGVDKPMKIKDLQKSFEGFTVLATNGVNVALLSDKGVPYISTAEKNGDEIIIGAKNEIAANAVFGEGENAVTVPIDTVTETLINTISALNSEVAHEKELRENAENALGTMQKMEKVRRQNAVKEAIKNAMAKITANCSEIDQTLCDDLLADEKVNSFAECEDKDGAFCGDKEAVKEVNARAMEKMVEEKVKVNSTEKKYAWEMGAKDNSKADDVTSAIDGILKFKE